MTIFQHTLKSLLTEMKTETSRLALPESDGEIMIGTEMLRYPNGVKAVCQGRHMRWTPKWVVGQDYAIQPNRGVKAVGRYRIEDIWKQDVRTLSDAQIASEGFLSEVGFLMVWCAMHDKSFSKEYKRRPRALQMDSRPSELYTAWRMSITVLWDTVDWDASAVKILHIDRHQELIKALNTPVR
jgi:hypothetical protein